MQASETTIEYLDRIYVYEGTPAALQVPGPYSVEAFFKLSTPHEQVFDPIQWLVVHEIPHEAKVETRYSENGFFLQISFASEELRNVFVQQYTPPAD